MTAALPPAARRVVLIGAGGHFGGRIARRLLNEEFAELVVTSRDAGRARDLAAALRRAGGPAAVRGAVLDQDAAGFGRQLAALAPDVVLHTAGPYQGQDYRVARAAIDCGSHYIDLADGRDFVAGIGALDAGARAAGVLVVAGASTLPGLSSAVIERLLPGFDTVTAIETTIAPAHRTPRGTGTVAAVLSYCGRPIRVRVDGRWQTRYGWQSLRVERVPGLGRRLAAACDVPDLELLPRRFPALRTATFHAALEAPWEQLALWCMAAMTRSGLKRDWQRHARGFGRLGNALLRFGSDRGGMRLRMDGTDSSGASCTRCFVLIADDNHGPEIPCAPALVIARRLLREDLPARGAMACEGLMSLDDFAVEMRDFAVRWTIIDQSLPIMR